MSRKIAMTPDELPQQRIYPVLDLPFRPKSFQGTYNPELFSNYAPEKILPLEYRPKKMPRTAQYIGTAEWAWRPMNGRISAYHISTNRQRGHWLLWSAWLDDNEWIWKWKDTLMGHGPKKGIDRKEAAIYLLMDIWAFERDNMDLDHFHFLNNVGLLSVAEFMAIGRKVWE